MLHKMLCRTPREANQIGVLLSQYIYARCMILHVVFSFKIGKLTNLVVLESQWSKKNCAGLSHPSENRTNKLLVMIFIFSGTPGEEKLEANS